MPPTNGNAPQCSATPPAFLRRPFFPSSYAASFKEVECMRLTYEPLLYKGGDFRLTDVEAAV